MNKNNTFSIIIHFEKRHTNQSGGIFIILNIKKRINSNNIYKKIEKTRTYVLTKILLLYVDIEYKMYYYEVN